VGDRYEFDALIHVVNKTATPTLAMTLELGAVTLATIAAFSCVANDLVHIKGWLQVQATGASGSIQGVADVTGIAAGSPVGSAQKIGASLAINLTANNVLRASATFSAASASNTVDLLGLYLTRIPSGS